MNGDTWGEAQKAIHNSLNIPSNLSSLVRGCWAGITTPAEFVHALSVPGYSPKCLLRAAHIVAKQKKIRVSEIEAAVEALGVRASAIIIAINTICEATLDSGPAARVWTPIFKEMMSEIELGYHFGSSAGSVGAEKGMLIGFSRLAGLAVLLVSHPAAFTEWYLRTGGACSSDDAIATFGCEPYQVSSLLLQRLGLGPQNALGAAVTLGALHPSVVEAKPVIQTWMAAFHWVQALKAGKRRPVDIASRDFFPELAEHVESDPLPAHLEILFEEVGKLRAAHSLWTWHLPLDSYEETAKAIVYKVKSKPYGSNWSRGLATRETRR